MNHKMKHLAFLISGLFLAQLPPAYAADTTAIGQIDVVGQGDVADTGLIQQDDTPKARSSVNSKAIEKAAPSATAFQLLQLAPGVSTFDQDGTGLFGGNIRVRGFSSNQMGLTLDGAPLNDSLNYSIFIQEFADPENTCDLFITQGSTDIDAPHVGASGGNVGITTCDPKDKFGGKYSLSLGSNNYRKAFVRLDTGKFMNDRAKLFLSVSQAKVDKFKGDGGSDRDHLDAKGMFDFGAGSFSKLALLYNRMNISNYRTLTKNELATRGYFTDFGTVAPVHLPGVNGTAQNEASVAANGNIFTAANANTLANGYQGFNNNPIENYQVSMVNHWQVSPKLSVDVNPYYIYAYAFGGSQLTTLAESNGGTRLHRGIGDLNGDGDVLDTIAVYGSNTSETKRAGLTAKANVQLDSHNVTAGIWQDNGRSLQKGPRVGIDSAGNTSNYWLDNEASYLRYADGAPIQNRDWNTYVKARTLFVQDSFSMLNDKLNFLLGLKRQSVERDFHNYANSGAGGAADYAIRNKFENTLGNVGVRYQLSAQSSTFFNVAQNVRAPDNNANGGLVRSNGSGYTQVFSNGVLTNPQILPVRVKPEKAENFDVGYRFAGDALTLSGSVFYVNYRDRIANQFDPITAVSTAFNVGKSRTTGIELESGYKINSGWAVYGSLTYTKSTMQDDQIAVRTTTGGATLLPTSGKQMPDTPNWLAGLNLQYTSGPFFANLQGRHVGSRYTTLVNDDKIGGYTLFDLGGGYRLKPTAFAKNPVIRLNISNLFDKQYLSMNAPSGSAFTTNVNQIVTAGGTIAAATTATSPQFYVGAPRALQITFTSEF